MLGGILGTGKGGNLVITEGDSWPGFYAAWAAIKHGSFTRVTVGVRDKNAELARELVKMGAKIVEVDSAKPESVKNLLQSAEAQALFFVPSPTQQMVEFAKNTIQAAEAAKVKRIVMWSTVGAGLVGGGGATPMPSATPPKTKPPSGKYKDVFTMPLEIENMVRNAKFENEAIIRVAFPMQALFALSPIIQTTGTLPLPSSTAKFAPVDAKDVARATVQILNNLTKYNKQTVTLTGTELVTGPELVTQLNKGMETQTPVKFAEVPIDQIQSLIEKEGELKPFEVRMLLAWLELFQENKLDMATRDLQEVLGTSPTTISQFGRENAANFRPRGKVMEALVIQDISRRA